MRFKSANLLSLQWLNWEVRWVTRDFPHREITEAKASRLSGGCELFQQNQIISSSCSWDFGRKISNYSQTHCLVLLHLLSNHTSWEVCSKNKMENIPPPVAASGTASAQPNVTLYWYVLWPLQSSKITQWATNLHEQARTIPLPTNPLATRRAQDSLRSQNFPPQSQNTSSTPRTQRYPSIGKVSCNLCLSARKWWFGCRCRKRQHLRILDQPFWKEHNFGSETVERRERRANRGRDRGMVKV